ncbi:hypothetical protein E4U48_008274 [Claviceps purpurea]|nr:hypothetical protein E4U37_008172 [Claviceps purpurea]KAG6220365.1 hypothetical protein E4U26_006760 [Claviceps purpurea]KAG6260568.1 hypothetical protein E4U48_008274 [Claviceps purpurea]
MTKYGIEDDWHLMDAHDEELSPISIEYEAVRSIPEINRAIILHGYTEYDSITGLAQGYAYQAAGPPLRNIPCDQALQRLTKEIFSPYNPIMFQTSSTPIRVALSLFSNNNLSQTAPGLSTVTLGS